MKIKFNSKFCTTEKQSKRLMALGLKLSTADCHRTITAKGNSFRGGFDIDKYELYGDNYLPAWSLSRLLEMSPMCQIDTTTKCVMFYPSLKCFNKNKDVYYNLIDCIEWLIKEGYFNKEYLEE